MSLDFLLTESGAQQTGFKFTPEDLTALTSRPIQFEEGNYAHYIWGGLELYRFKGLDADGRNHVAESWEFSAHEKFPSKVKLPNQRSISLVDVLKIPILKDMILGMQKTAYINQQLPFIGKFFDAQDRMSIQVHPSDLIALELQENDPGKSEIFVVLETYPNYESKLYLGLKEGVTRQMFEDAVHHQDYALDLMHAIKLRAGDMFFIPLGTLHCWTGGSLAVEITEPSDLTYRLHDFGRGREMHLDKGLKSIDFENQLGALIEKEARISWLETNSPFVKKLPSPNRISVELVTLNNHISLDLSDRQSFDALMCIDGRGCVEGIHDSWTIEIKKGQSCLVPSSCADYRIVGEGPKPMKCLKIKSA